MKKVEFIKKLVAGGASKCDMGINSLYVTTDKIDGSKVYMYIKRSDALQDPFFGLQDTILEFLESKPYLIVLLDGLNKKTYVLEKEDVDQIINSRKPNKNGSYLVHYSDLTGGVEDNELERFFEEEISIFDSLDSMYE